MFTSSSDELTLQDRSPHKAWMWGWLGALALAGAMVGGAEAFWRMHGFRPDVPDTPELWSFWRGRTNREDGRSVVLLGTSRMKADIDLDTMRDRLPGYSIVQLAIVGDASPIGTLQHLADDEEFRGVVLCGMMVPLFQRSSWHDQREFYDHRLDSREIRNTTCLAYLQGQMAAMNPELGIRTVVSRWLNSRQLPELDFRQQTFYRSLRYDFARVADLPSRRRRRAAQYRTRYAAADASDFIPSQADYSELNDLVGRIRGRGGNVVFIRLPSSGGRWELEEKYFPKSEFWNPICRSVDAVSIHCRDVPGLAGFGCPDDSHLGRRDSASFTEGLVDELVRLSVFRP